MPNPILRQFSRILEIPITGTINQQMTQVIHKSLNKSRLLPIKIVIVPINSSSGSLTQAQNIVDILRNFSQKNNVPFYCFAEDNCLGAANTILVSGTKSFASEMSMLGDFGFTWVYTNNQQLANKYKISIDKAQGGSNNLEFNSFEELNKQTHQFMQKHVNRLREQLIDNVMLRRSQTFRKLELNKEKLKSKLFDRPLIAGSYAKECGLIDQITTREQFKQEKFPGYKSIKAFKKTQQFVGTDMKSIAHQFVNSIKSKYNLL